MTSLKIVASLVAAVLIAIGLTFGAVHLTSKSGSTHSAVAQKTPGVAVSLVACGNGQSSVECIAVYQGQCVVIVFDQSGKITGAQPAAPRYCGLS